MTGANSYGTDPQVSASLTYHGTLVAGEEIAAQSNLDYQFVVSGPAGTTVPITLAGLGAESISVGGGSGAALAQLLVYPAASGPGTTIFYVFPCSGTIGFICADGTSSGSFDADNTLEISADTVYDVQIETAIGIRSLSGDSTPQLYTGESSVDPTITLDTTNPAYSLEFSPAPTPEPGSLWLALTGALAISMAGVVKHRVGARD